MNYEKKYKESLERAKEQLNGAKAFDYDNEQIAHNIRTTVYNIFPELKESEDEKMRKSIIYALRNGGFYNNDKTDEALAWLEKQDCKDIHLLELKAKAYDDAKERMSYAYNQNRVPIGFMNEIFPNIKLYEKQGEQKSVDKVAPKFKVGNWVVYNRNDHSRGVIQIYDIRDNRYYFNDNIHFSWSVKECDEKSHLWTIEDAKEGDVLDANGAPFIYKKHDKDCVYFYCGVNLAGELIEANGIDTWNNNYKVYPATKEQYDLLFQKMKEEGYEWNKDKKKLIKL